MNKTQRELENQKLIQQYCLMDDDYMTAFFNDNIPGTELVLRILLSKDDLIVKEVKVQNDIKNLQGHSARMDVVATDSEDRIYNIEVQNVLSEANPKRARYYSSLLDASVFPKGEDYKFLSDTYIIFITKGDYFENDKMFYHFVRKDEEELLNDGSHIIYVNSQNRDDSAIGKLMQDFVCTNPNEMCYDELRKKSLQLKGNVEGEEHMDRITTQIVNNAREDIAEDLLRAGDKDIEKIAKCVKLPIEKVQEIAAQID